MRQTLFLIPREWLGIPLFGWGWLLAIWMVVGLAWIVLVVRRRGWDEDVRGTIPFFLIGAAVIAFVLPWVELSGGLPVRGYGVCLLIATVSGVALAHRRAVQVGLNPQVVLDLAFWMFVGGIVGARLFFVVQKWEEFYDPTNIIETLKSVLNFVEGGLVVYGALIGGLGAGFWFLRRRPELSPLAVADVISPGMALGLAIGRIGCLMNGCCYGGLCEYPWAIQFPARNAIGEQETPPYYDQHASGMLYGFRLEKGADGHPMVAQILPDSAAARCGLPLGARVLSVQRRPVDELATAMNLLAESEERIQLKTDRGEFDWSIGELPSRSLPVHPTQIYSSVNAMLLCLLSYFYFPYRRRDGEVFVGLIGLYAVTRFLLEIIRTDEKGFWITGLTISQNVSILLLLAVVVLSLYLYRQPKVLVG